jgi:hypothetical protein
MAQAIPANGGRDPSRKVGGTGNEPYI